MTPQEAWEKRYPTEPWVHLYTHAKDPWLAARPLERRVRRQVAGAE